MPEVAVTVENVSKIYRIWNREEAAENLATIAWDYLRSPLKNYRKYRGLYDFSDVLERPDGSIDDAEDILWALRDVSFEVTPGEVVGIVGVNGAGKTTLLKILSRITPPTQGNVRIRGRVSSLLEVGTGFHPELSGRENVYLNGTILGMRKREIDAKFDQIVEFSGVERFLETPVKRYSSGMRVRLAFSVAAHLEPEVLIIDEVLAVGDAAFQQKCLSKMEQVGQEGRTVLFVSHNMPAVTRLCQRGILLSGGRLVMDASATDVVSHYLTSGLGTLAERRWPDSDEAPGDEVCRLRAISIVNERGEAAASYDIRHPIGLRIEFDVLQDGQVLLPQFFVSDENAVQVFVAIDQDPEWQDRPRVKGRYIVTAWIPGNLLSELTYYVSARMRTPNRRYRPFHARDAVAFHVVDPMEGGTARGQWAGGMGGVVRPMLDWRTRCEPAQIERSRQTG
jgi:lipopolysaccharide transport system ATP-binding protein